MAAQIFWFRRDLRLADQPALAAAAAAGPVLPVFVIDDALRRSSGANRLSFLAGSLAALDIDIGGHLVIRSGAPAAVLAELADEVEAETIWATDDFGPYGRRRDTLVGESLAGRGLNVHYRDAPYAVPPNSVVTGGGTPFKVFTPFFRAWKAHGWSEPTGRVEATWVTGVEGESLETPSPTATNLPEPGEEAAWERADAFLDGPVFEYDDTRNDPGIDGTSRLSPYLKWGTIHPRQLLARLGPDPSEDVFRSELAWREFYAEVLFQRPETARSAYASKMAEMEVDEGEEADARFDAWCRGTTGYPIVDAGMRQLVAEGWMHNRVRMIVASFLVKDLHIDWTRGARFFMDHLVDGDLASNQHGWQWVAGTGTDASPYFRVFNPIGQSRKFDPSGRYLRRWVPEIEHLGDKAIHEPWSDPAGPPAGYPPPVVDHGREREESLARYARLKETW
jgi:deoxyribodipyrimidine photo-lyase